MSVRGSTKRKAPAPTQASLTPQYDRRLWSVVRTLDRLTRVMTEPLSLPVVEQVDEADDDDAIEAFELSKSELRVATAASRSPVLFFPTSQSAWTERRPTTISEVHSDVLQALHDAPAWRRVLDACVASLRKPLGITPQAILSTSFRNALLVHVGGRVKVQERDRTGHAFGSLMVMVPGYFDHRTGTWRSTRDPCAAVTFVGLYDHCTCTRSVAIGTTLFLVYDLTTTTPRYVPACGGQRSVNRALRAFFDELPIRLKMRYHVSPDVARMINAFVEQRQFVHIVAGSTFERLDDDETKIATSLVAFCAASNGQYVLYLARVQYRRDAKRPRPLGSTCRLDATVTLTAPWLKYGESVASDFPSIPMRDHRLDIAPMGYVDYLLDRCDAMAIRPEVAPTRHALVVLPLSMELRRTAQLPLRDAIAKIYAMMAVARDDAVRCTQFIVREGWRSAHMDDVARLVELIVALDDHTLLVHLLWKTTFDGHEHWQWLHSALRHFGWDACAALLVKKLRMTPSSCRRVYLVLAVVEPSEVCVGRVDGLLDALLSFYPWTNVRSPVRSNSFLSGDNDLTVADFGRLLELVWHVAPQMVLQVVSVTPVDELVRVVVPSLQQLAARPQPHRLPSMRDVLVHVQSLLKATTDRQRYAPYTKVRVFFHCAKCVELHSFFLMPTAEVMLSYKGSAQREHIEDVLERNTHDATLVEVYDIGNAALRLVKARQSEPGSHQRAAEEILRELIRSANV